MGEWANPVSSNEFSIFSGNLDSASLARRRQPSTQHAQPHEQHLSANPMVRRHLRGHEVYESSSIQLELNYLVTSLFRSTRPSLVD